MLSAQHELNGLRMLRSILQRMADARVSSVADDEQLLRDLDELRLCGDRARELLVPSARPALGDLTAEPRLVSFDTAVYWQLLGAVNYRLTRKLIVDSVLAAVEALIDLLGEEGEEGAVSALLLFSEICLLTFSFTL